MVEQVNLDEMQNTMNTEPVADPLAEIQATGVGQYVTPFYQKNISPNLINLPPDYALFFTPGKTEYENMLKDNGAPIGYENGVKPVYVDKNLSMEDRLNQVYSIQNNLVENISPSKNYDAVTNLRDTEGVVYVEEKGKFRTVNIKKEKEGLNFLENTFGDILPFVTGPDDLVRRKRYEQELAEMGLTPEKAKQLQKQLKQSYYYTDVWTGKIKKHEEAKDLSYLIPREGDASFQAQAMQIFGRITNDFPSLLTGLGVSAQKQYTRTQTQPNEKLLDIYTAVSEAGVIRLKTDEELRSDVNTYIEQEQKQLEVLGALTERFDQIQNTNSLFMPYKELYRNIVYNNTGFNIDGPLLDKMSIQNPDESILFHIADTSMEALPYVATLNGIMAGFGLRGTKLADETLDYALKNSGPGMKHANPIEAANSFFQIKKAQGTLRSNSPNKFIQRMQTRFEKLSLTQTGVKKLQADLTDEIKNVQGKIKNAVLKNDKDLVEKLMVQQETLVAKQTGLTVKHYTTQEQTLFRNEIFASTFGGVGDYLFGVNSGASIAMEVTGALIEPYTLQKNGFIGLGSSVIFTAGRLTNWLNSKPNMEILNKVTDLTNAQYAKLNLNDLQIVDSNGIPRRATPQEILGLKGLTDLIMDLPPQRRAEIIGRMNAMEESLALITKNLSGQEKNDINIMFGQFTGLSALQALDEIYAVQVRAGNLTSDVLKNSNDYIVSQQTLLTEMDKTIARYLGRSDQTPEFNEFINKIDTVVKETKDTITTRQEEMLATFDLLTNYMRTGNMFDNTDLYQQNMENFITTLKDLKLNGASEAIQQKSIELIANLDEQIFKSFDGVSKGLLADGSNYKANYFPGFIDGMYTLSKVRAQQNYIDLFNKHQNVRVDVSEFFDSIIDETVTGEKFGKLQNPISQFANKLPSSYETNGLVNVINSAVKRNTSEFISNKNNHQQLLDFLLETPSISPDKLDVSEEVLGILSMNQNLSKQNTEKVYGALRKKIKLTFPNYKNVNIQNINAVDIRNALGGNIKINLNLDEAMNFRSGLGFSSKAAQGQPNSPFYANLFKQADDSILNSINAENNVALLEDYRNAINQYSDFSNRFQNFDMLSTWTKTKGKGSYLAIQEAIDGTSKKEIVRINSINKEATEIANKYDNSIEVPNFIHQQNPNTWINYEKLLSDERYADKFMQEAFLPIVGTRNVDRIGQADEYFLDFNNPETLQKIEMFSKFLTEELGAHIRRTDAGQIAFNKEAFEEAIKKDTPGTIKGKKISIFNGATDRFAIDTPNGKVFLLPIDDVVNMNVGIDVMVARNSTVNTIAKNDQVKVALELKKVKTQLRKQVEEFKFSVNKLSDASVVVNFGDKLTDPNTFVKNIVEGGSDNYDKLERLMVKSGKMTAEEFNTVAKNLISEYFYNSFARNVESVSTPIKGQTLKADVKNFHTFNSADAREFLTRNTDMLKEILGTEHYNDVIKVLNIQALTSGADTAKIIPQALPSSLSLESLMSRLYAINRGVISPRYVVSEIALRRFNKNKGVLIKNILENPKMATVVRKMLEQQDVYADPTVNKEFYNLLKEGTFKAIILREYLEAKEEDFEGYEQEFLRDLNQSVQGFADAR